MCIFMKIKIKKIKEAREGRIWKESYNGDLFL